MEVWLNDKPEPEKPELPVMTKWSSEVIDAVVAGRDISYLTPYRKWKEKMDEEEGRERGY